MSFTRRDFVAAVLCSGTGVAFAADKAGGAGAAGGSKKPVFVVGLPSR